MAKKGMFEKGFNTAEDVVLIGVGQASTSEIVDFINDQFEEPPGAVMEFLVEAGVPVGVGSLAASRTNTYVKHFGVGMAAAGGVNAAKLLIKGLKGMMESDEESSSTAGTRRRAIAANQSRQLPSGSEWRRRQQNGEAEKRESGMLSGTSYVRR